MIFLESLMVALSTYSIIPMPSFRWNEKNMKYAICFFPVVGIICGLFLLLLDFSSSILSLSDVFVSLIAACIPIIITGGIHMDGFMDTIDAISSHQSRDKKLEILKDSHCGAFAVIYCVLYFALCIAFLYELCAMDRLYVVFPIYTLSRCASAVFAVNLPKAKKEGMLQSYTVNADRKVVNVVMITGVLLSAAYMIFSSPFISISAITGGLLWSVIYIKTVKKHFGGVTGDTAGFFLQIFELFCIIGAVIGAII